MLTTLSILSRDQGKLWREDRPPLADTPHRAVECAVPRPAETALSAFDRAICRPSAACA